MGLRADSFKCDVTRLIRGLWLYFRNQISQNRWFLHFFSSARMILLECHESPAVVHPCVSLSLGLCNPIFYFLFFCSCLTPSPFAHMLNTTKYGSFSFLAQSNIEPLNLSIPHLSSLEQAQWLPAPASASGNGKWAPSGMQKHMQVSRSVMHASLKFRKPSLENQALRNRELVCLIWQVPLMMGVLCK